MFPYNIVGFFFFLVSCVSKIIFKYSLYEFKFSGTENKCLIEIKYDLTSLIYNIVIYRSVLNMHISGPMQVMVIIGYILTCI